MFSNFYGNRNNGALETAAGLIDPAKFAQEQKTYKPTPAKREAFALLPPVSNNPNTQRRFIGLRPLDLLRKPAVVAKKKPVAGAPETKQQYPEKTQATQTPAARITAFSRPPEVQSPWARILGL